MACLVKERISSAECDHLRAGWGGVREAIAVEADVVAAMAEAKEKSLLCDSVD